MPGLGLDISLETGVDNVLMDDFVLADGDVWSSVLYTLMTAWRLLETVQNKARHCVLC